MVIVVLTIMLAIAAHTLAMAVISSFLGYPPKLISVFTGPVLFHVTVGDMTLRVGLLPLGGFVDYNEDGEGSGPADNQQNLPPPLASMAIGPGPMLLLLVFPVMTLGLGETMAAVGQGIVQYVTGGVLFWSEGPALLDTAAAAIGTTPPVALAGLVVTKIVAVNVLPAGSIGSAVSRLLAGGGSKAAQWLFYVGLMFTVGWFLALIIWMFQ